MAGIAYVTLASTAAWLARAELIRSNYRSEAMQTM
jgi:hypothetical protein